MRRNRTLYGVLFALSLVHVYFYGGKVPYTLFYVTLALPFVSFGYTLIVYLRFKYTQDTDKKYATKGEKIHFLFNITNEDFFLYPYIKVNFCGEDTVFVKQFDSRSFSLLPLKGRNYAFELECKYRGYYAVGIKSIEIEDFLGILKLTYNVNELRYVTVYPRIVCLERFDMKTNFISESNSVLNSKYEDMSTISDIRSYIYGDSLKKMHWKLTAKMNELMVKNYQSTSETSATIFLDIRKSKLSHGENIILEDKIIEAAVAVIYYCLSNWVRLKLVYYSDEIVDIEAKNPLEFDDIYKVLSRVQFNESIDIKDILDIYMMDNITRTNIIIFTSNISYDLYDQIYKIRFIGNEISLIYVSSEEITGVKDVEADEALSFLTELGVSTYKINISNDIKQVLECS